LKNRILAFCYLALCFLIFFAIFSHSQKEFSPYIYPEISQKNSQKIILLPLDSRPPCYDFPAQLGELGNIEVITPPLELMDQNLIPAKKDELFLWLEKEILHADALILSTDALLHGGLVASRRISPAQLTPDFQKQHEEETNRLLARLWQIKKDHPHLKIYGFSIIPRQLVSGEPPASYYEPHLYHYSQYSDKVATFELPKDLSKLADWRSILPDEVLAQYQQIFRRNLAFNQKLIDETEKGLFTRLIIAQDDAKPFGIPNWYRRWAEQYAHDKRLLNQTIFFTGGTDEIAQLLVAHHKLVETGKTFNIFLYYTEKETPHRIFPFMREALDTNTYEKLRILGATLAKSPEEADLILAIHGGFPATDPDAWQKAAEQIKNWLKKGYPIAITDVSRDFSKNQSLFPHLLSKKVPILELSGYAGWNTASNSLGTALSQGILFRLGSDGLTPADSLPARRDAQARFLLARFLDDWSYQKEFQDRKNTWLRVADRNPYELGYSSEKIAADIRNQLDSEFSSLRRQIFFDIPYRFTAPEGERIFWLTGADLNLEFPWQRTFEIRLTPTLKWKRSPQ